LEIKAPGLGIPAIISAVCFVLIFWSYSWLSQEVNSLAILLFLLGLILIGVEIFVLPGFGIWGIGGVILLLLALALAVAKQWPQSEAEYLDLGKNIAIFGGGLLASLFGAFTIARYLPSIPYASRLMLAPPDEESGDTGVTLPLAQSPALLGQIGSAVTELRPAGKARFGEEFVDVIAEGSFVSPGTRVQVVEMDGMRVVVKAV
jgi:membrane-bound ClpP family serine protease